MTDSSHEIDNLIALKKVKNYHIRNDLKIRALIELSDLKKYIETNQFGCANHKMNKIINYLNVCQIL